jgi:hypothetical protein
MSKTRIDDLTLIRCLYDETSEEENQEIQLALTVDSELHERFFKLHQSYQDLNSFCEKSPSNWVVSRIKEIIYPKVVPGLI